MRCTCNQADCRAEITFDRSAMIIQLNDCAGIRVEEPEFRFPLDANSTVQLIKELKAHLLELTQTEEERCWSR